MLAVDRFAAVHFCSYSPCRPFRYFALKTVPAGTEGFVRTGERPPFADQRPLKQKSWPRPAFLQLERRALQRLDVRRGRALLPLRHVEGDLLALFQRFVAGALDRAVMGEQILAAVVRRDETEALGVVEPLHGACWHVIPSAENCSLREAVRASLRARWSRE